MTEPCLRPSSHIRSASFNLKPQYSLSPHQTMNPSCHGNMRGSAGERALPQFSLYCKVSDDPLSEKKENQHRLSCPFAGLFSVLKLETCNMRFSWISRSRASVFDLCHRIVQGSGTRESTHGGRHSFRTASGGGRFSPVLLMRGLYKQSPSWGLEEEEDCVWTGFRGLRVSKSRQNRQNKQDRQNRRQSVFLRQLQDRSCEKLWHSQARPQTAPNPNPVPLWHW